MTMKNKIIAGLALAGLCLTATSSPAFARKVRIKLGTLAPEGTEWYDSIETMGRRWKEASGGEIQLTIYPGGALGDESEMVEKMRRRQLHAATITSLGLGSISRATIALQIPMMFSSYEELDYVREKLAPKLAEELGKGAQGFVVLDWGDAGWVQFFSKEKALTPAEMKKQRLFVWTGDPESEAAWRAAGFNVVPTASSDVLQGLQTGRLEAFASVPLYAATQQWFGLAPNMLAVKWAPLSGATVVTKDAWEKIDAELRPKLIEIAKEESRKNRQTIRGYGDRAIATMKKSGLKVFEPDAATVKAWRETAESAYPAIRGKIVPENYFDEVQKLVKEFRAKGGAAK